jgi:hypothetical protein
MRLQGRDETGSLETLFWIPFLKQAAFERTASTGGADGDNVLIQHLSQSPVSFKGLSKANLTMASRSQDSNQNHEGSERVFVDFAVPLSHE